MNLFMCLLEELETKILQFREIYYSIEILSPSLFTSLWVICKDLRYLLSKKKKQS